MENYDDELLLEKQYLANTLNEIEKQLQAETSKNTKNKQSIVTQRKEMWDNAAHTGSDVDKLAEISQYLQSIGAGMAIYETRASKIVIYKKMLKNPYFARIDFTEEGEETDHIYIGISSVMDEKSRMYVYDWRAPISSVFYRFETGAVQYEAPMGLIKGNVSLKRQYEINQGELAFFFDVNINVADEFLRKMLSGNTSDKMKTIVETIQRDQDLIIRDMENELLMVQGVAGSGKTSVALHRVAYLMYQGLSSRLGANNIVIISPNTLFSEYISNVLPELGETDIDTFVFEQLFQKEVGSINKIIGTRNQFLESLMDCRDEKQKMLMKASIEFKTSPVFMVILSHLIDHFEKALIDFHDVYYDERCIFTVEKLKSLMCNENTNAPIEARLNRLEKIIFEKVHDMHGKRIKKLEDKVRKTPDHILEIKEYARLLSIQESTVLLEQVRLFTQIDYINLYETLFNDEKLFNKMAEGLALPDHIDEIINYAKLSMKSDTLLYEDVISVLYLKTKMSDNRNFQKIKQVVVDEAQDYYPIHFEILNTLFSRSRYTILGDMNQTIEKTADISLYESIENILNKKKSLTVIMNKSFRCTNEILAFSQKFVDNNVELESFNRSGEEPQIFPCSDDNALKGKIMKEIENGKAAGYKSIGVLCKSTNTATKLFEVLKDKLDIKLISENNIDALIGVFIIPVYMAKGLEFDAVLIHDVNSDSYKNKEDKNLLYIACTRALHKLSVFYKNEPSQFLN